MQFFVRPGEEMKWWQAWKETRMAWHRALGFGDDRYRFHDHEKLAHYANAATDIEYNFPFGFKEVEGIHSRTDFDLGNHQKFSGKKIQYFDTETGESYVPYVVETSIGVDRMYGCSDGSIAAIFSISSVASSSMTSHASSNVTMPTSRFSVSTTGSARKSYFENICATTS